MLLRLAVLLAMVTMGCSNSDPDILPDTGGTSPDGAWHLHTPRCPTEVMSTTFEGAGAADYVPQYPMTYVEVITGANEVPSTPFTAQWTGIRRLAPPITRPCLEAFVTEPPGLPCQVDTVLSLTLADDTLVEILVGLPFEKLEPFADGRTVSVLLGPANSASVPDAGMSRQLEMRDENEAGALLLAVESGASLYGGLPSWTWDDFNFGFDETICATERDSCMRVFISRKLMTSKVGEAAWYEPGRSVWVGSRGLTYLITYRRGVERAYGVFPAECADLSLATSSVEMVREP